ncbi:MAG: ATP-binding protein [bacterium]
MTSSLTLRLLGPPLVEHDGQPLSDLPSRAAEALLIYLACTGRAHARDVVAEMLWDEREQSQALANLRSILSSLRRAKLGAGGTLKPFLHITRQTVSLAEGSRVWLDVADFEERMGRLSGPVNGSDPLSPENAAALEEALSLYRGDFLEGFYLRSGRGFEEWALLQRERLRRLAHSGLFRLATYYLAVGQYAKGLGHAERLVAIDPLDERARRLAMLLLARNGQRNAALQQYESLRRQLLKELGVSPTAETVALFERIRTARSHAAHNLPPRSTPFVGRAQTLRDLIDDLNAPGCRLLTILGPGGVGKTRLLLELGRRLVQDHPGRFLHGVRYVPLAHLEEARFLPAAIAEALEVTLSGSGGPLEDLIDYLREKEVLLLLDNLEHLLGGDKGNTAAVDALAAILRGAPLVTVVLTSRERLYLQEEWVHDLEGLRRPPPGWEEAEDEALLASAGSFSAVALFVQSAQRAARHFQATADDLRAIAAVCRRLDGLPLGIELAATWARQLPCADIFRQIEEDLDFLVAPARNAPARHRSLRAVFEHSWRLLDEAEQAAVAALTVFQDAFTAEAAQRVAGVSLPALTALVDKSFLHRSHPGFRFEMHRLLRQYAAEHLTEDEQQRQTAHEAHARYFADFVDARTQSLEGAGQQRAYREIGEVIDDVRAAWNWSLQQGCFGYTARFLEGLFTFYWARGWLQEGAALTRQVEDTVPGQGADERRLLAQARMWQGEFYGWLGRSEEAEAVLLDVIEAYRELGDETGRGLMFSYSSLGRARHWRGALEEAIDAFESCLALAREAQDEYWIALALNGLAIVAAEADADYERAWAYFGESLDVSRAIGDRFGTARALVNMGTLAQGRRQYDEARQLYEESLAIYREVDYEHGIATALSYLGELTYLTGEYEQARALIQEGHDLNRESGNRRALADSLRHLGNVAREMGEEGEALQRYEEALRLARQIGAEQVAIALVSDIADLLARRGQVDMALTLLYFVVEGSEVGRELREAARPVLQRVQDGVDAARAAACREDGRDLTLEAAMAWLLEQPLAEISAGA